ncbi:putative transcription factor MYB21-like [Capsicum annuum]|nr:putative transcription factor MYB21-like [Capsicum annuum]KAF3617565.1 putative transcription factor MYB21-like [Capsicum annuum]
MYWYSYWKGEVSKKSLATGVLQEIARRCNSKVEFGTVVSTIEELQFSVKVFFTGEKVGVRMGKNRKDAQQQEAENTLHNLDDLVVNEAFLVAFVIQKLPPLWKDIKNYLNHKSTEMFAEDLIMRLRIEEDNKIVEKMPQGNSAISRENIVEDEPNKSNK